MPEPKQPNLYRFAEQFRPALDAGTKVCTLRSQRKTGHAHVGARFDLAPTAGAAFANSACVYRATVVLKETGVLRVINPVFDGDGERLHRIFQAAEQGAPGAGAVLPQVAQACGFASWDELITYHRIHGLTAGKAYWREAIGFAPVGPAAAASAAPEPEAA